MEALGSFLSCGNDPNRPFQQCDEVLEVLLCCCRNSNELFEAWTNETGWRPHHKYWFSPATVFVLRLNLQKFQAMLLALGHMTHQDIVVHSNGEGYLEVSLAFRTHENLNELVSSTLR